MASDPFLGSPELVATIKSTVQVKGNLVRSRPRYVAETWGAGAVERLAGDLSGPAREYLLNPPMAFQWSSIAPLMEVDQAIYLHLMGSNLEAMKCFGATIGKYDLNTVYRMLIRLAVSPKLMLGKAASIWPEYFRPGESGSAAIKENHAVATFTTPLPTYLCTYGVPGWIEEAVRMTGAKQAKANHVKCMHRGDARCETAVDWS